MALHDVNLVPNVIQIQVDVALHPVGGTVIVSFCEKLTSVFNQPIICAHDQ